MTLTNATLRHELTIDGEPVTGDGAHLVVYDPATEERIADFPGASTTQVDGAIAAARHAFDAGPWPSLAPAERAEALHRFADVLEANADEILELSIAEVGTPITLAKPLHTVGPFEVVRHFAELARQDRTQDLGEHHLPTRSRSLVAYRPAGVAVGIAAYNYPVMLGLNKAAAALAAGCTHIWIPSPMTPLATLLIGALGREVFPSGVLNVIAGGPDVGVHATERTDVDRVSFTGSVEVGRAILRQAAQGITQVILELGGKSANIVMPGCPLDERLVLPMHARYARNAGQGCMSPTRILVQHDDLDAFIEISRQVYDRLVVGDPRDPATVVGPLIRPEHRERVEGFIDRALAEGATVLAGGGRPSHLTRGWYMNPTLLGNLSADSELAQTEMFGPVAVVLGYRDIDEAVQIANGTEYGLAAYVNGSDLDEALQLASRLRAGGVFINGGGGSRPDAPIGGVKASGIGREKGEWGLREFMEPQHIQYAVDGR